MLSFGRILRIDSFVGANRNFCARRNGNRATIPLILVCALAAILRERQRANIQESGHCQRGNQSIAIHENASRELAVELSMRIVESSFLILGRVRGTYHPEMTGLV